MHSHPKYLLLLPVIIVAAGLVFYYDQHYQELVRWLYVHCTGGNIYFKHPGKYFHFASKGAVVAFAAFCCVVTFFELRNPAKKDIIYIAVTILLFFATTVAISAFASYSDIVSCTACTDGRMMLYYASIDYDLILYASLGTALFTYCYLKLDKNKVREQSPVVLSVTDRTIQQSR